MSLKRAGFIFSLP